MTQSPTPQAAHCPLSHPPHPSSSSSTSSSLLPHPHPPSPLPLTACSDCGGHRSFPRCRGRDSVVTTTTSTTSSSVSHHHHHSHNYHPPHHHHPLLPSSAKKTLPEAGSGCACSAPGGSGNWPEDRRLTVVISKTVALCRTLLVVPALVLLLLLLLLLLPHHRRKDRRHRLTKVPGVLLTVCLLTMLTSRALASPWIEENANSVKLRARVCQPVPDEHLRGMLGADFDPSRMSNEEPRTAGKRGGESEPEEAAYDSFYMEDDPGASSYMDEDFVDLVTEDAEEEEEQGGWFRRDEEEEEEEAQIDGNGFAVKEKDFEAEEEEFYQKKTVVGGSSASAEYSRAQQKSGRRSRNRRPDPKQRYPYMKRRRRAASPDGDQPGSGAADSSSKDSLLPLRLLLSGRNRKLRRRLKKVFRKKAKKLGKKPPPWTCNMTKVWGRLKEGYFPRYLLDGRCVTDKCFYRLYNCVPQKYRVKVLKRDPDYCNPLPALGANSTYEQKWSVVRYYVTVGCNCEASDPLQRSPSSGRRRNS